MSEVIEQETQVAQKRHSSAIEKGSRIATVTIELDGGDRDVAEKEARDLVEKIWRERFGLTALSYRDCPVYTIVHSLGTVTVELVVGAAARPGIDVPLRMSDQMFTGDKYTIEYQVPGIHRVPRRMVASYMGSRREGNKTMLDFSGRPVFGTTSLDRAHIAVVSLARQDAEPYTDRKVR